MRRAHVSLFVQPLGGKIGCSEDVAVSRAARRANFGTPAMAMGESDQIIPAVLVPAVLSRWSVRVFFGFVATFIFATIA